MSKVQIKISEIFDITKRQQEINKHNLSNIDFIDDNGEVIKIDNKILADYRFCGLDNISFITSEFYKTGFTNLNETK